MTELLTKGSGLFGPVIKKAAAIFLSITLMCIGSIPQPVSAAEHGQTDGMIAANPTVLSVSTMVLRPVEQPATDILDLPKPVFVSTAPSPFDVPILEPTLEPIIWKPELVLGEHSDSHASSRIPTLTGMITSAFGWRKHPVRRKVRHHDGIDLAAKLGNPVLAPAAGRIVFAGVKKGYGNVIEIDHENGYTTLLAHHSRLLVKVGDYVQSGMEIAKAGRTGVATGVHVHVEVRQFGKLINPRVFLAK